MTEINLFLTGIFLKRTDEEMLTIIMTTNRVGQGPSPCGFIDDVTYFRIGRTVPGRDEVGTQLNISNFIAFVLSCTDSTQQTLHVTSRQDLVEED